MRKFLMGAAITVGLAACSPFGSDDKKEAIPTPPPPAAMSTPAPAEPAPLQSTPGLPQSTMPGTPLPGTGGLEGGEGGSCESEMTEQDL